MTRKPTASPSRQAPADIAKIAEHDAREARRTASVTIVANEVRRMPQINFAASREMAELLQKIADKDGCSMRKVVAQLLQKAGYKVPAEDLNPPRPGRKRSFR